MTHLRRLPLLLLGVCLAALLAAQPLPAQPAPNQTARAQLASAIEDTIGAPTFEGGFWGIRVMNLRTGAVLYDRNAAKRFVPASNVKLITAATALERLGPDFRYRTRIYADGPVEDGILQGNLIVRGAGDPSLGGWGMRNDVTQVFRRWADSLRAAGIHHIRGNIVGDDRRFNGTSLGDGWSWKDLTYGYGAPIGGLVFNENKVDIIVEGGPRPGAATVSRSPDTEYVRVLNQARTVPPEAETDEEYNRRLGTNTIEVRTRLHPGEVEDEAIAVEKPTAYFTTVLREVLVEEGISISGRPTDLAAHAPRPAYSADSLRRVATYRSPSLRTLVRVLNHESRNLYAEQLLRTIALEAPSDTQGTDVETLADVGILAAKTTLAGAEADTSQVHLVDGSGLSRQNYVRPQALTSLLQHMWVHPDPAVSSAFFDSLPTGGKEGTLAYRFQGRTPANGNVRAKTGTLSNVIALTGYVNTQQGTPIAFTLLSNHHIAEGDAVRAAQDAIVNAIANLPL